MRHSDQASAESVLLSLDLASLCADARADRAESLPADPLLALAVVALSLAADHETLTNFLMPPEETFEAAGRALHAEVRHQLVRRFLRDVVTEARNSLPKGKNA